MCHLSSYDVLLVVFVVLVYCVMDFRLLISVCVGFVLVFWWCSS